MISVRRGKQLVYSLLPLGGIFLALAALVGGPVEVTLGAMTMGFGVLASAYVRRVSDESLDALEPPTPGSSIIRMCAWICMFSLVMYLATSTGIVEPATIVTRPLSIPLAAGALILGATVGVGFPFLIARVDHPRVATGCVNLLVLGLFVGLLVAAPGTGLPYAGAFLVGRSGVFAYILAWK